MKKLEQTIIVVKQHLYKELASIPVLDVYLPQVLDQKA